MGKLATRRTTGTSFVSTTEPVVPVPLPALFVELATEKGIALADLLANTGLRAEHFKHPETFLSYAQIATLIGNGMRLTGDPAIGLTFGQRIRTTHMAELGEALACAPTLGDVLETTIRFQKLWGAAFDLRLADLGQSVAMIASKLIPLGPIFHFNQETWLTTMVKIAERLAERELPDVRVEFSYSLPAHVAHAARYREVFGDRVRFDQPYCQVIFPKALLARPLPGASSSHFKTALAVCEQTLARRRVQQSLPDRVRQLIRSDLADPPKAEDIADSLHLSVRSLNRRLTELDTSYRQLLAEERAAAAASFLRESTLPVQVIAARLGFDNPSNFVRAFRAWKGATPQQFRNL